MKGFIVTQLIGSPRRSQRHSAMTHIETLSQPLLSVYVYSRWWQYERPFGELRYLWSQYCGFNCRRQLALVIRGCCGYLRDLIEIVRSTWITYIRVSSHIERVCLFLPCWRLTVYVYFVGRIFNVNWLRVKKRICRLTFLLNMLT